MSDFPAVIDLGDLDPAAGFMIQGDSAGDGAGFSISDAGDVNGDGFDDVIVGSPFFDGGGGGAGAAHVIFGKSGGFGTIDLTGLSSRPADGFVIPWSTDGLLGWSVSSAGDINGDGFADIIVGIPRFGYDSYGRALVKFGASDMSGPSVGLFTDGYRDYAGYSVSSAGDINGDGFGDILVGAPGGHGTSGCVYVVFGKDGVFSAVYLDDLFANPADGFVIEGDFATGPFSAGDSVSSAGDINNDGFDDIIVGAPDQTAAGTGKAYVLFGKSSGFATVDLANLAPADGFTIEHSQSGRGLGTSVSSAGDVNGDGFDDVIIGSSPASGVGPSYVVFGKAGGFGDVDVSSLDPSEGFTITGRATETYEVGHSVSSAGDVNGDGFDDLIVDVPESELGSAAIVIFGKATGFAQIKVHRMTPEDGFTILRAEDSHGGFYTTSVSSAGDVNGDGFDDLIVGDRFADNGGVDAGAAYVIFGRAPTTAVERFGAAGDQVIRGGAFNDTLFGAAGSDTLLGAGANDRLTGNDGDDELSGGGGKDTLIGGNGDDRLVAGKDADVAKGGAGVDTFVLSPRFVGADRMGIDDFKSGVDELEVDAGQFGGGLVAGPLDADAFRANAAGKAKDAEDRFVYDTDSGALFFDADGTGAGAAVLLAQLSGAPTLKAGDFLVTGATQGAAATQAVAQPEILAQAQGSWFAPGGEFAELRAWEQLIA